METSEAPEFTLVVEEATEEGGATVAQEKKAQALSIETSFKQKTPLGEKISDSSQADSSDGQEEDAEGEWEEPPSTNQLGIPQDPRFMLRRISAGEFSTFSFNQNGSLVALVDGRMSSLDLASEPLTPTSPTMAERYSLTESESGLETTMVGDRIVVAQGTAEALVAAFMGADELSMDQNYLHDFLATFRFFLSPPELLELIVRQYGILELIRQRDRAQEESKAFAQRRLLNFLRKWFERFTQDFIRHPGMELRLRDFLTSNICQVERHLKFIESFYSVIEEVLGQMVRDPGDSTLKKCPSGSNEFATPTVELLTLLNKLPRGASPEPQKDPEAADQQQQLHLSESNVQVVAEQLTALEFALFLNIEELEYTDYLKAPQDYPTPNLTNLIDWGEETVEWVGRQVCSVKDVKERADTVCALIMLAKKCKDLGNYNAVFEIMSGLLLSPVTRLQKTWKSVTSHPKIKAMWTELTSLISPAANYQTYCLQVADDISKGRLILPWVKIFLSDLEIVTKSTTFTAGKRVNFYKFHLIARILRILIHCKDLIKSRQNELPNDATVRKWLQSQIGLDQGDSNLQELSIQCEAMLPKEMRESQKVFGTELSVMVSRHGVTTKWTMGRIPRFARDIFDFLEKESSLSSLGLFRTSGNQHRIQELKEQLDECGGNETFSLSEASCHDVAGLLKLYLRELPEPLITSKLLQSYFAVSKIPDQAQQVEVLKSLSVMLPDPNRNMLAYILKFLYLVSTYSEKNKMDAKNLSVCLAPTFFGDKFTSPDRPRSPSPFRRSAEYHINGSLKKQAGMSNVLRIMIESQGANTNFSDIEVAAEVPEAPRKKSKMKMSFSKKDFQFLSS